MIEEKKAVERFVRGKQGLKLVALESGGGGECKKGFWAV
jgi:hypothetical protein